MKITDIEVDGFGVLHDFRLQGVSPRMTVLYGPNEAGKSTLLDFLRGMLGGFPTRRKGVLSHEPLRGGKHGGRLRLLDDQARALYLERYVGQKSALLRTEDGKQLGEDELHRVLGGADDLLFRSVFAFGLSELSSFSSLDNEEVRDVIFSAGVLGAGRSATRAMQHLENRQAELVKPRQQDVLANQLQRQLDHINAELREARAHAENFPSLRARVEQLREEAEALREQASSLRTRLVELQKVKTSWPTFRQAKQARTDLQALGALSERAESLILHATPIRALLSERSGHARRLLERETLESARNNISARLSQYRAELEGLDLAAVEALDEGHEQRARELLAALRDVRAEHRAASSEAARVAGEHERASQALAGNRSEHSPSEVSSLEDRAKDLRALVASRDDLQGELHRARASDELERRLQASSRPALSRGRLSIFAFGVLAGLVLAVLGASRQLLALEAGGVAVVVLSALGAVLLARRSPPARWEEDDATARLARNLGEVSTRADQLAAELGLSPRPIQSQVELFLSRVEKANSALARQQNYERELESASVRLAAARERQRAVGESLVGAEEAVASFAARIGLGTFVQADDLEQRIGQIRRFQDRLSALDRVENQLEEITPEIDRFESDLRRVCSSFDLPLDVAVLIELEAALEDAAHLSEQRAAQTRLLEGAEQVLRDALGEGSAAKRLLAEIESGEVLSWDEEVATLTAQVSGIEARRDEAVSALSQAERELSDALASSSIADLEFKSESVTEQLKSALREWMTLGVARSLLDQTLARYERERQPAVIARASELFSKVTHGRYLQLVAHEDEAGKRRGIEVIAASGERIDSGELSRGTAEQLYLCLRLAFASTFGERAVALPLVFDDVLVNFDPERARAIAEVIATTADEHQVLAFTCQPHVVEYFQSAAADVTVLTLDRTN